MPLYTYRCSECGKTEDAFRSIAQRLEGPECHVKMTQVIVAPMIQPIIGGGNFPGYKCPVTDEWVSSRKQRKEIMKRHSLEEKG